MTPAPTSEIAPGMKIADLAAFSARMPSANRATARPTMTVTVVPTNTQATLLKTVSRVPSVVNTVLKLSNPTNFLPLSSSRLR